MTKEEITGLVGLIRYTNEAIEYSESLYEYHVGEFEIVDLILDDIGFPRDTTVELGLNHKDSFCQDYLINIICDLNLPKNRVYDKLIFELNELEDDSKRP